MNDVEQRVQSGVYWLREHAEEYGLDVTLVDIDTLDVSTLDRCVLAQANADEGTPDWSPYGDVIARVFGDRFNLDGAEWAIDHGFAPRDRADADALNAQWRAAWGPAVLRRS